MSHPALGEEVGLTHTSQLARLKVFSLRTGLQFSNETEFCIQNVLILVKLFYSTCLWVCTCDICIHIYTYTHINVYKWMYQYRNMHVYMTYSLERNIVLYIKVDNLTEVIHASL